MGGPVRGKRRLATVAVVAGLLLALVTVEVVLRCVDPEVIGHAGWIEPVDQAWADDKRFLPDDELGFRPELGPPPKEYAPHGMLHNDYTLEKPDGVERLLFLGDSVTHRGKIIDALRGRLGDEGYEYWNAGVEAYGTAQEVAYYARHGSAIAPDHVILTFHINDFEVTPIWFRNGEGELMKFHRRRPQALNPWLWRWSYLYRFLQGLEGEARLENSLEEEMAEEIEDALRRLKELTARDGARLSVLILPLLGGTEGYPEAWAQGAAERVERAARILDELGIPAYDLTAPHDLAMERGVVVREASWDPMHPSRFVAAFFADHLLAAGLFGDPAAATEPPEPPADGGGEGE